MIIFIDDSGDPSFSLDKGSTKVFVIGCVIFDDELEAEKTAVSLKQLRRDLHFSDQTEFKFNKSRPEVRLRFLSATLPYKYRIRTIVMKKEDIYGQELRKSKSSFYNYAIKSVLKNSGGTIRNAKLRLDGHGDRLFTRNMMTYLKKELNSSKQKMIIDLKLVDSKQNILIQMADMIAGAIRRSYDHTKHDKLDY